MLAERLALFIEKLRVGRFQRPSVSVEVLFLDVDLIALGMNLQKQLFVGRWLKLRRKLLGADGGGKKHARCRKQRGCHKYADNFVHGRSPPRSATNLSGQLFDAVARPEGSAGTGTKRARGEGAGAHAKARAERRGNAPEKIAAAGATAIVGDRSNRIGAEPVSTEITRGINALHGETGQVLHAHTPSAASQLCLCAPGTCSRVSPGRPRTIRNGAHCAASRVWCQGKRLQGIVVGLLAGSEK